MSTTLLIHVWATCFMTGLIWFVQVVHYPLFARVGSGRFPEYEQAHQRRTSMIVSVVMPVELITGVLLVMYGDLDARVTWPALALLGAIWLSTVMLQMPRHQKLARRYNPHTQRTLVSTNWIRTIAWTLRSLLLLYVVA